MRPIPLRRAVAWDVLPAKAKVQNLIQAIDGAVYAATREIAMAR